MKKTLNILLIFSMIFCLVAVKVNETVAAETISFVNAYEKIGQEIKLDTNGLTGNLTYKWEVNGKTVSTNSTYTPAESDENRFIEVTVSDGKSKYSARTFLSKLPVIYIEVEDGKTITSKEEYVDSNIVIQGNDQYNSKTTTLYKGKSEIKGRGNSTWKLPKKPYRLKLDKKTDLFGFGKSKHWVLLANWYDETFLRNKLGYDLAGAMGIPYMQSILVDVVMNGEYIGNYQFCEQIRIDEERVEITDWESIGENAGKEIAKANKFSDDDKEAIQKLMVENFSWVDTDTVKYNGITYNVSEYYDYSDIDGGYLLEMDEFYDEVSKFKTDDEMPIMFKEPEFANTSNSMMNYVKTYIQAFENSVKSPSYTSEYEGEIKHYSELFDMQSLVDNWLVQEIFFNQDFMKRSTYMYKNHGELFKMGPVWDLDWSSGTYQMATKDYDKWQTKYFTSERQKYQWYKNIVKDPYFIKLVQNRYLEIRDTYIEEMLNSIDTYSNQMSISAQRTLKLWGINKDYQTQVNKLKTWMNNRLNFMDEKIADFDTFLNEFNDSATLIKVTGASTKNNTTYHHTAKKGTVLSLTATGHGTTAQVWVNNENVATVNVINGVAKYSMDLKEDCVIQFYFYDGDTLTSKSYTSISIQLPFSDVSSNQWYYSYVKEAYDLGLMTGATETLFKPNSNMNRGMVAIVFHRMEGSKKVEYSKLFPDVPNNQYYTTSVLWAKQKGIINGYKDGTFKPEKNITREELITIIYNFAKYKGLNVKSNKDICYFNDYDKITPYARITIAWAVENGLISGKDNGTRLDPLGTATRSECAKILVEAYKVIYK